MDDNKLSNLWWEAKSDRDVFESALADYETLRENLTLWARRVDDVRYDISYRRISYAPNDRVYVEIRYGGSFHIERPATEDEQWSRRLANHRLVLQKLRDPQGEDEYRILSGM